MKDKIKELLIKLNESNLNVDEQFKVFKEKTNKSRITFFRYRKELNLNKQYKDLTFKDKNKDFDLTFKDKKDKPKGYIVQYHFRDKNTNEWVISNSFKDFENKTIA